MNFLEFYNSHFMSLTILFILLFVCIGIVGSIILKKIGERKIKTPGLR